MSDHAAPDLDRLLALARRIEAGGALSRAEARWLVRYPRAWLPDLFAVANRLRLAFRGPAIKRCSIINAKAGACPERCDFCAQSAHFQTAAPVYDWVGVDEVVAGAETAARAGAMGYGLVATGYAPRDEAEFAHAVQAVAAVHARGAIEAHASLGVLDEPQLRRLQAAGLTEYHHNLETCRRLHPEIVKTHTYDDEVETLRIAKRVGLRICCGGIFGLGETWDDRVDFAWELAELAPDTIPMNLLIPVAGTPLAGRVPPVAPLDFLRTIALFRFVHPRADLLIAAGRDLHLRDLQSHIFYAGASGMMIGDFLTTRNRRVADDLQMLADLELAPAAGAG